MTKCCYLRLLSWVCPTISLAILPLSLALGLIFIAIKDSTSSLNVVFPLSNVSISVCKFFFAFAFNFTWFEISVVSRAIRPNHSTFSIHIVFFEITFVKFPRIREVIFAFSFKFSVLKVTFVVTAFEFKATLSSFLSVKKLTSVFYVVKTPWFSSKTVLLIVKPFAHIHATLSVNKDSIAVGFSIFPVSLIDVTIHMSHSTFTIILFIFSLTLILTAICEFNYSKPFPSFKFFIMFPMALVFLLKIGSWSALKIWMLVYYLNKLITPF